MPTDKGYRNTYASSSRSGPSKGSNASSDAARRSGKRSWQRPGGPAPQYDQQFRQAIAGNPNLSYNQTAYNSFAHQMALGPGGLGPASPTGPGGPGGGGRGGYGGGGGGGGGGGSAMTQAMFDQMVAALGQRAPQLALQQQALPAFQGQNIAAFNPAAYNQAQQSLNTATAADRAAVNANAQQTTQALNNNFTNDYANAQVDPGVQAQPVGASLQGTAGPVASNDPNQQVAANANADNSNSQAAFANVLKVLAANAQQGQASRLNQVSMDRGTAQNAINAQSTGLGAGINMARTQGQQQWAQQDQERRYQNSMMGQQWNRESLTRNQDLQNQQRQLNWQQTTAQMQARLQPILDLIASSGAKGINMANLTALLNRQQ